MGRTVTVDAAGKVFESLLPRQLPLRPLKLLDPKLEHSSFSPHYRPDGAPNYTALLLHLPEFNSNPQVTRPKRSLLGEQSRGWWEGGWRLKASLHKKNTQVCSYVWWPDAAVIGVPHTFMGGF